MNELTDINIKDLSVEQFLEMKKRFDNAENDTTPFAIVDDNEDIKVIGDVNKTEKKKFDYIIRFAYRNTPENKEALKDENIFTETENYIAVEREYHDAWIPPRRFTDVQATMVQLYKFFNAITPEGAIRDLTEDEALVALNLMNSEMIDAMCDVVGVVLGIPEDDTQAILATSAIGATLKMVDDFPEVINGVDFITDKSLESN